MNAGRCVRGLAVVSALLVGTVASAAWQISSTDNRMVSIDGGEPMGMGPRCTVIFGAGHSVVQDTLRLPRGTLEMFIDRDTVAYRMSGLSGSKGGNNDWRAPAIQFHRLQPGVETYTAIEKTGEMAGPNKPCDWQPDSLSCEEGTTVDVEGPVEKQRWAPAGYLVRSMGGHLAGEAHLVLPPTNVVVTPHFDSGDMESSYWIDYGEDVWSALRHTEGSLSMRVYFPGYVENDETAMRPEHPHYVNWSLDMGMMEGDANEVFAKLEGCATAHGLDPAL